MSWPEGFLGTRDPTTWNPSEGHPTSIKADGVFVQPTASGLEVAVATARQRPTIQVMRKTWKTRHGGRAAPVLLIVGYPAEGQTRLALCGPAGDDPPVYFDLEPERVERLAETALSEPSRHAAQRCLVRLLPDVDTDLPGVVNVGLLATQELRVGVPARSDWENATSAGKPLLGLRGQKLVESLGYSVVQLSTDASLLKDGEAGRAVGVFLDEGETFDAPSQRFEGVSPVSRALALADREHLAWVMVTRSSEIRLYAARADTGVGRKGRAETFVELNLALLPDELAGYLELLFSARALVEGGSFDQILDRSADFAANLAARLRDRVYKEAVPALAAAVATRMAPAPSEVELAAAYEQTLVILFRLLFVAYGEDKELLPYRTNSRYADHSLKRIARRLAEDLNADRLSLDNSAPDMWEDVAQLWRAVDKGNTSWGVPAYNGGLFSSDPQFAQAGAALAELQLTDAELGPALIALLLDETEGGAVGPVDFRSLSVREFGTIYEGLLESDLDVAEEELAEQADGTLVPAGRGATVVVPAGQVYLHDRSGSRKATGSYFTKPFAVEHLLDHALEPALDDHVARLQDLVDAGDEAAAAAAFFDFRCVDMAMGSGHFLVAAVDRIEARLGAFLALHPIPHVTAELDRLRDAALEALGDLGVGLEIETTSLLRRQVARRCVYGVDRNHIAVELARLALWIHTFVPGLPLSFLDHSLVEGDSLTGVATIEEALASLVREGPIDQSLFRDPVTAFLERAATALRRLATLSDTTVADVASARAAHLDALEQVAPARALFDLIVAHRLGEAELPESVDEEEVLELAANEVVRHAVEVLQPLHFPVAFPEVFLRERAGFDCIVGNPPWEEVLVDERAFWALRYPGIRSLPVAELNQRMAQFRQLRPDLVREYELDVSRATRLRSVLLEGPFPGIGTGHPDLYKAFCWRFWQTCRDGGAIGVVLPRSALSAKGSALWRRAVLEGGAFADTTMILNNTNWAFPDVHPQYTFGLVTIRKGLAFAGEVHLRGPFSSFDRYRAGVAQVSAHFPVDTFLSWSEDAAFPLLPSPEAVSVFQKLQSHPRLDSHPSFTFRPVQGDLNATTGKPFMVLDPDTTDGLWPVYKGASFNLWRPDTGVYYAWADPGVVTSELQSRRLASSRRSNSVFRQLPGAVVQDPGTLPCRSPRISYRRVARATDSRTIIASLVPPDVVLTDKAAYLLRLRGSEQDEAFLIGVLGSMILDWYARRIVEIQVDFFVINALPIPSTNGAVAEQVAEIAARLAAVDDRYAEWAVAAHVPVGSVSESERDELIAELDASVARLYGLDAEDLRVIYATFHEGANYDELCERVISYLEATA